MSSSDWGNKLESKLSGLGVQSSKESLQTVAKWIAFNRKRAVSDFVPVFVQSLRNASPDKQEVLVGVIHEVLILDRSTPKKWERLEELRLALGEQVLLPVADHLVDPSKSKILQERSKEWDDANSFGDPMILNQIRKKLSRQEDAPSSQLPKTVNSTEAQLPSGEVKLPQQPVPESVSKPEESPPAKESSDSLVKIPRDAQDAISKKKSRKDSGEKTEASTAVQGSSAFYDFESHGILAAPVDAKQFQEPCRAIATLQIARDLRNDGAVQLSSLLSSMPEDVRIACANSAENDNTYELDEATARDFSMRINASLLDMSLEEQLQNVQTFRSIVDRQRQARQELIRLLIQSRCKFGAEEAAAAFYAASRAQPELLHRKHILTDAMELEGLDVGPEDATAASKEDKVEDHLVPLTWYTQDCDSLPGSKRARIESM